jgi:hypothetical protein
MDLVISRDMERESDGGMDDVILRERDVEREGGE